MMFLLSFTIEKVRVTADLVDEFECPDSAVVTKLVLDMAIIRKFDDI